MSTQVLRRKSEKSHPFIAARSLQNGFINPATVNENTGVRKSINRRAFCSPFIKPQCRATVEEIGMMISTSHTLENTIRKGSESNLSKMDSIQHSNKAPSQKLYSLSMLINKSSLYVCFVGLWMFSILKELSAYMMLTSFYKYNSICLI